MDARAHDHGGHWSSRLGYGCLDLGYWTEFGWTEGQNHSVVDIGDRTSNTTDPSPFGHPRFDRRVGSEDQSNCQAAPHHPQQNHGL